MTNERDRHSTTKRTYGLLFTMEMGNLATRLPAEGAFFEPVNFRGGVLKILLNLLSHVEDRAIAAANDNDVGRRTTKGFAWGYLVHRTSWWREP